MVTELNIESYVKEYAGSGGSVVPELPDKDSLTLGNMVMFASHDWIVSHVTSTEAYLTLSDVFGESDWHNLQSACTNFANQLTDDQKSYLKSVTAGNTSGKVFVATKDQMDGGFSYFNSDSRRSTSSMYWTSTTDDEPEFAWSVESHGRITLANDSASYGFRPTICIDLTLYDSGISGGGSEEPELNPELPNESSLTIGNTVTFANKQWIVSHKTADSCYLTLTDSAGKYTWRNLQNACTNFADQLTEDQKACLKTVTADNTSGKVFVATKDQMDGGFSYFNSNSHRSINEVYWTSTEFIVSSVSAYYVDRQGYISHSGDYFVSSSLGFRPSVCIDMTLYT